MTTALLERHLVPNLFDPDTYFDLDVRAGVMRNRSGAKCIAFSGYVLRGLYVGLKNETGPAWRLVLRRCGELWGARFAKRFLDEVAGFYNQGLDDMTMARFNALLEEYFSVHGWGRVEFDYSHIARGVVVAQVRNPIMAGVLGETGERTEVLLEGVLKSLFSAATGQDLDCLETQSAGMGAGSSLLVIAPSERMAPIAELLESTPNATHAQVLAKLLP